MLADTQARALQGSGAAVSGGQSSGRLGGRHGRGECGGSVRRQRDARAGIALERHHRQDFSRAVIIIDSTRTAGVALPTIADYVAFVALAQINPNASAANYPTILNLFANPPGQARPTQMTSWDVAYLDALYHMTRDARNLQQERSEMARRMSRP